MFLAGVFKIISAMLTKYPNIIALTLEKGEIFWLLNYIVSETCPLNESNLASSSSLMHEYSCIPSMIL